MFLELRIVKQYHKILFKVETGMMMGVSTERYYVPKVPGDDESMVVYQCLPWDEDVLKTGFTVDSESLMCLCSTQCS